jgi:hypothetical protein
MRPNPFPNGVDAEHQCSTAIVVRSYGAGRAARRYILLARICRRPFQSQNLKPNAQNPY